MARNEEKQLARLNRFYLEKQKQEDLKKRPPRPRLDTLTTSREVRKWLPTITRDIEFYVKQMEVTCYTDSKIEEFNDRIQRLKKEYKAYIHKLRALEPDNKAASWADRPYTNRKRRAVHDGSCSQGGEDSGQSEEPRAKVSNSSSTHENFVPNPSTTQSFVPISTPILNYLPNYAQHSHLEQPAPLVWNVNPDTQDQPLQFCPPGVLAVCDSSENEVTAVAFNSTSEVDCGKTEGNCDTNVHERSCKESMNHVKADSDKKTHTSLNCLNLDYSDSSDEDS